MDGEVRVSERLSMFDPSGELPARSAEIWAIVKPEAERIARAYWERYARSPELKRPISPEKMDGLVRRLLPYLEDRMARIADDAWADRVGGFVTASAAAGMSPTSLFSGVAAATDEASAIIAEAIGDDPVRTASLTRWLYIGSMIEIDVYAAHSEKLRRRDPGEQAGG